MNIDERRKTLHLKRLRESLEAIPELRARENRHSAGFHNWERRTQQSLTELFGPEHPYVWEFASRSFWEARVSLGTGPGWTTEDRERYGNDLTVVEQVLRDALEEYEVAPVSSRETSTPAGRTPSTVVVNIQNVLSMTQKVSLEQVLLELDDLDLGADKREEAERLAKDFAAETKGEQRWSVLGGLLDGLKRLGRPVYEKVALPLLLEMLKRQAGLGD